MFKVSIVLAALLALSACGAKEEHDSKRSVAPAPHADDATPTAAPEAQPTTPATPAPNETPPATTPPAPPATPVPAVTPAPVTPAPAPRPLVAAAATTLSCHSHEGGENALAVVATVQIAESLTTEAKISGSLAAVANEASSVALSGQFVLGGTATAGAGGFLFRLNFTNDANVTDILIDSIERSRTAYEEAVRHYVKTADGRKLYLSCAVVEPNA